MPMQKNIFAQQIRQRNRQKIRKQVKDRYMAESQILKLFKQLPESLHYLSNACKQRKSQQYLISTIFLQLLKNKNIQIFIESIEDSFKWGIIVSSCFQYYPQEIKYVLENVFQAFWGYFERSKHIQSIHILISAAINSIQLTRMNPSSLFLFPYVQKVLTYQQKILQNKINQPVTIHQLVFLRFSFLYFPGKVNKQAQNQHLYTRMLNHFDHNIDKITNIAQIIKIILIVTFNDGQILTGVTQKLLNLNILQKIRYIIQYMDDKNCKQIKKQACHVLMNIASNIGSYEIIQENLLNKLYNAIEEMQFPIDLQIQYAKAYLTIISNITDDKKILQTIRQCNCLQNILFLIEKMGVNDQEILQRAEQALYNLFAIGQAQRKQQGLKLNPYILHFDHENGHNVIAKFPNSFHDLMSHFNL